MKLVLVCDDAPEVRLLVVRLLERMGLRTISANNGLEALYLIRHYHPDLVLSDIQMPNMNGIELFQTVKEDTTLDSPQWIMMSSSTSRDEAVKAGCPLFLPKPFTAEALNELVSSVLCEKTTVD